MSSAGAVSGSSCVTPALTPQVLPQLHGVPGMSLGRVVPGQCAGGQQGRERVSSVSATPRLQVSWGPRHLQDGHRVASLGALIPWHLLEEPNLSPPLPPWADAEAEEGGLLQKAPSPRLGLVPRPLVMGPLHLSEITEEPRELPL